MSRYDGAAIGDTTDEVVCCEWCGCPIDEHDTCPARDGDRRCRR